MDDRSSFEPGDALAILRAVPLFAELAPADLERIAARARIEDVPAGTTLIVEGSEPAALYIVERGELDVTKRGSGAPIVLNTCGPGDLLGELSALENRPRTATVTARTDARVVVVDIAALHELLRGSLAATLAILRTIASRLGNTEAVLRQHDTLAGLGRIAAGLAHELNNPASAVKRGAVELGERLTALESAGFALRLDDAALARVRALAEPITRPPESAMQRARREQAIEAALETRGIANAWELAPSLGALGWDDSSLARVDVPVDSLAPALRWVVAAASTRSIPRDVADAAGRISDLVGAVKTHSHLGEAPVQGIDVHAGLDSTLALFRHQLGDITVTKHYGDLPKIDAHGSELNQVWTNLIDNALHAMGGKGELTITTRRDGDRAIIEIVDSGSGIPAAILHDIWKPFFTTKGVGEGTGLGLHLAHNVVVRRHRGTIDVESRPGRTCFRVALPIS
jgi:signal transduction histidine kinase